MKKIADNFHKLYDMLPIFGPLSYAIKPKYRYAYSKVYYCASYRFSLPIKLLLYPVALFLWYIKVFVSIWNSFRLHAHQVIKESGIGLFKQTQKLFYLGFIKNTPPVYFYNLALFDQKLVIGETYLVRNHFLPIFGFLSDNRSRNAINNKYEFWLQLKPSIKSIIEITAVVKSTGIEFLHPSNNFPEADMFLKPVNGFGGRGCDRVNYLGNFKYQFESSKMVFDKKNLALYLKKIAQSNDFILQPNVKNHPEIDPISNGNLSTCRIVTYLDRSEMPEVLFGMFMTPVDNSISSNANGIFVAVNIQTGALSSVISPGDNFKPFNFHPEGKGEIAGTILPLWEEAKNLCKLAHNEFNDLPIIAWDIAFTPEGAILVEGNLIWDVELWQQTHGNSINTEAFISMIEWHLKKKINGNGN